jgi:hypothetical protein
MPCSNFPASKFRVLGTPHDEHQRLFRSAPRPEGKTGQLRRLALTADHESAVETMTPIPNNVEGAFLISIIDFVLSFVIISGIGVILAILPVVNRYWAIDDKDLKGGH